MLLTNTGRRAPTLAVSPQVTKCVPVPAPQKGVNAVDGLIAMSPEEAIFCNNMSPSQYGTRVRTGYQQWRTGVVGDGNRTLIPYIGSLEDGSADRLFVVSSDAIYDVSSSGTAPAPLLALASISATSGYGIWTAYTTIAGHFALYCDEQNGYYRYPEGGPWVRTTGAEVTGVNPNNLVAVTIFKSKAWFVERNTAFAWYLPTDAVIGAATRFNFGNKFKKGGTLQALFVWTVDGGQGVDDYLVAVSSAGDVVVYKGNDPASATDFVQHGVWFIGPPPVGRRIGGNFGGELNLLSSYGLLPMSALMSGQEVIQDQAALSRKITPLVNSEMAASRELRGWEVKLFSKDNALIISSPKRDAFPYTQFAQSTNNEGWSVWRDIPYLNGEEWKGDFYVAAEDGNVYILTGNKDNVSLDGSVSTEINWSVLQSFQDFGEPGLFHRGQYIRPVFIADQVPSYTIEVRYDYNLSDVFGAAVPGGAAAGALWDVALWDLAVWGGDFLVADTPQGGSGIGRAMAIGINGSSQSETILVRYDLMFDTGGML